MTVARRVAPNNATQSGSTYKANIDAAFAVDARFGGMFAPHQVYAGSPNPDRAVEIDAGFVFRDGSVTEVATQTVTGFTTPASSYQRIDRVVIDAITGVASRVAGTAQTSGSPGPSAPAIPTGKIPCCQVLMTASDTVVTNDMITDERAFVTPTKKPTRTVLTSGTGATYTTPTGATRINFREVGAGAGGGAASANSGAAGGDTTFGSWVAKGGSGGSNGATNGGPGGRGGISGPGTADIRVGGNDGQSGAKDTGNPSGGDGGPGPWGGSGTGGIYQTGGTNAQGYGSGGGGGGGSVGAVNSAGGGGGGEYVEHLIVGPAATYTYTIGAAGAGGAAGTYGGGNGFAGVVIVDEYYD